MAVATETINLNISGNASQQIKVINNQVQNLNKSFDGLRATLSKIAVSAFVVNAFRAADALDDLATASGLSIATINGLSSAFIANGGSAADVEQAIGKLSNSIDDARNLNDKAIKSFERIGISFQEIKTLDTQQILRETIKGLGQMPAGAARTALAMELLGKNAKNIDFTGVNNQLDDFIAKSEKASPGIQSAAKVFNNFINIGKGFGTELAKEFEGPLKTLEKLTSNTDKIAKSLADLSKVVLLLGGAFLIFNKGIPLLTTFGNIIAGLKGATGFFIKQILDLGKAFASIFTNLIKVIPPIARFFGLVTEMGGLTSLLFALKSFISVLLRLGGLVGLILGVAQAIDFLYKIISGDQEGLIEKGIRKIKEYAQSLGFLQDKVQEIQEDFTKPLVIEGTGAGAAQKMAEGFFEMGRANKELAKNITEVTNAYQKKNKEALNDLELQTKFLNLSDDQILKLQAEDAATQRVKDAIADLNKLKEQAKPYQQDYINQINATIAALNASIPAERKAAGDRVESFIKIKNAQEDLRNEVEQTFNTLQTSFAIEELQEQLSLLGLEGDALERQQTLLEANSVMRSTLIDLAKQMTTVELNKDKLGEAAYNREKTRIQNQILDAYKLRDAKIQAKEDEISAIEEIENSYYEGAKRALISLAEQYKPINVAQDAIMMTWQKIGDAVDTFVETGKFKFSDFARSVIQDLAKMIAKAAIFFAIGTALKAIFPESEFLKTVFKAQGGPVKGGSPYIVGEKGPELFVPQGSGKIVPNNQLGTASTNAMTGPITNNYNTYNINALDAKSVAQLFAENRKAIFGANKLAEREMSYAGVR